MDDVGSIQGVRVEDTDHVSALGPWRDGDVHH